VSGAVASAAGSDAGAAGTGHREPDAEPAGQGDASRPPGDRLTGTLVHRLFQAVGPFAGPVDQAALTSRAAALVPAADRAAFSQDPSVPSRAARVFAELATRPDVAALLASGTCLFEVPFSWVRGGGDGAGADVVRGTIDCLVVPPEGAVTVVDFKTGAARVEDERQVAMYVAAVQALCPGREVRGAIVRAGDGRNREEESSV